MERSNRKWIPPLGCWKCAFCSNINFPKRAACNRCKLPRITLQNPNSAEVVSSSEISELLTNQRNQPLAGFQPPIGSWRCANESCRNINFPQRGTCNLCGANQPSSVGNVKTPPVAKLRPGSWMCPRQGCGNVNFPFRDTCNRCNTIRPSSSEMKPTLISFSSLPSSAGQRIFLTPVYSTTTAVVGATDITPSANPHGQTWTPPPGSWRCTNTVCNNINFATRRICNKCQQPRADTSVGFIAINPL